MASLSLRLLCSVGLSADKEERHDFLITLVLLHNFRVRTGRPNQIRSVYADILEKRCDEESRRMQHEAAHGAE